MKLKQSIITGIFILFVSIARAQSPDDILNILIQKGTITQSEADSIRAESALKKQAVKDNQQSYAVNATGPFQIYGYTQARYQYYQLAGQTSGFDIRRARLDVRGNLGSQWEYRLQTDFVGNKGATGTAATGGAYLSPLLLDAYAVYKPWSFLKITAGQFLIPFSRENGETPDRDLLTVDRSQVVNALVARSGDGSNKLADSVGNQNGRDIGIQLLGNFLKVNDRYIIDYYIALLNGAGINSTDNNGNKDISTRIVIRPFKSLRFGGSYYNGVDRFTSSTSINHSRIRWGTELAFNYNNLAIVSEYIKGWEGSGTINPTVHEGWYAQAGYYIVPKKLQGVFKYDTYNPNTGLSKLTSTYYVFGVNYYFTQWAKIQADYSYRTETGKNIPNDIFTAQLQIAF
jgi:phosphate-selective porin OprO/OprP